MERSRIRFDALSTAAKRKYFFALLYFCEGAPIGFIWWMLPTQLRSAGVPVERITLMTSLLVLPWALKFLWAPAVDLIQNKRWTLKSWIVISQMMMAVSMIPLLVLDLSADYHIVFIVLLLHTISAATQDVAIDALCIASVPLEEQGRINGWMQAGMLAGRSVFGGIALMVAVELGVISVLTIMIVLIITVAILLTVVIIPQRDRGDNRSLKGILQSLRSIVRKRSTWYGMAFAVFGGFAFEGVGIVAGPFMIDRGISAHEIGLFFSFPSVGAMIFGAIIGGMTGDRFGRQRSVKGTTAIMACSVMLLALIDLFRSGDSIIPLIAGMTFVYFSIGLFTASTYALFMEVTDVRVGATQFSAFMGATNLCESLASFSVGVLIASFSYPAAFIVLSIVSLMSIPLVRSIQRS